MSIRVVGGVVGGGRAIDPGTNVTILDEDFSDNFGNIRTPGLFEPEEAWSRGQGATPSGATGPAGGSNVNNRGVQAGNAYAFTEGTPAGGGTANQRTFTMETTAIDPSFGLLTLTFDFHMRFGSEGLIDEGTLSIQGWNGSAYVDIGPSITGSQQRSATAPYLSSVGVGAYTSQGFTNDDFRFRFKFTSGASANNFDCAIDNVKVVGPEEARPGDIVVDPGGGDGGTGDGEDPRSAAFNSGTRRLHCSSTGAPPIDGTTPDLSFTNLQAAIDACTAGDVLTVGAGTFTGTFRIRNIPGSVNNPCWIAAEVPGTVIISNYLQGVKNGTTVWRNEGGGRYSIPGSRPFTAADLRTDEFLPGYASIADINATSIPTVTGANNPSGRINKPQAGFAFSNGRIHMRLRDNANPTGIPLTITNGFSRTQIIWEGTADNTIIDGFFIEGGGDGFGATIADGAQNPMFYNCVFEGGQFGVLTEADDTLFKYCEFFIRGTALWQKELRGLNGQDTNAAFRYAKNYYNAGTILGNGNFADALMEGGFETGVFNTSNPANRSVVDFCYLHDVFDGSKCGRIRNPTIKNTVFDACLDDAFEAESTFSGASFGEQHVHDCLIKNCFGMASYQGDFISADCFFYRNVCVVDDTDLVHPAFALKMIFTPDNVNVRIFHNLFINPSTNAQGNEGFGRVHWVWFNFGNSTADRIRAFYNNIVSFPNDLDAASDANLLPANRFNNIVVSPADNTASNQVEGTNGRNVGSNQSALQLNADFSLRPNSPAVGAARSLFGGDPDSRSGSGVNDDCGPFPLGEVPGPDWPRPARRFFSTEIPERWPFS